MGGVYEGGGIATAARRTLWPLLEQLPPPPPPHTLSKSLALFFFFFLFLSFFCRLEATKTNPIYSNSSGEDIRSNVAFLCNFARISQMFRLIDLVSQFTHMAGKPTRARAWRAASAAGAWRDAGHALPRCQSACGARGRQWPACG